MDMAQHIFITIQEINAYAEYRCYVEGYVSYVSSCNGLIFCSFTSITWCESSRFAALFLSLLLPHDSNRRRKCCYMRQPQQNKRGHCELLFPLRLSPVLLYPEPITFDTDGDQSPVFTTLHGDGNFCFPYWQFSPLSLFADLEQKINNFFVGVFNFFRLTSVNLRYCLFL